MNINRIFGNTVTFVLLYLLFMIPTYLLPYLGSNSYVVSGLTVASGAGINPVFWPHLVALVLLIVVTWSRGVLIEKKWLIIFPTLAAVFDLGPALNTIPLVPTVMHLLAIILGVVGASKAPAHGQVSTSQETEFPLVRDVEGKQTVNHTVERAAKAPADGQVSAPQELKVPRMRDVEGKQTLNHRVERTARNDPGARTKNTWLHERPNRRGSMVLNGWERLWVVFSVILLIPVVYFTATSMPDYDLVRCFATVRSAAVYEALMRAQKIPPRSHPKLNCSNPDEEYRNKQIQAIHKSYRGFSFTEIERTYRYNMERLTYTRIRIAFAGLLIWLALIGTVYLLGWAVAWVIKGFKR